MLRKITWNSSLWKQKPKEFRSVHEKQRQKKTSKKIKPDQPFTNFYRLFFSLIHGKLFFLDSPSASFESPRAKLSED